MRDITPQKISEETRKISKKFKKYILGGLFIIGLVFTLYGFRNHVFLYLQNHLPSVMAQAGYSFTCDDTTRVCTMTGSGSNASTKINEAITEANNRSQRITISNPTHEGLALAHLDSWPILTNTANEWCTDNGYDSEDRFTTTTNYSGGYTYFSSGVWTSSGNSNLTKITSVTCNRSTNVPYTVQLQSTTYNLTATINLKSNVTLKGNGRKLTILDAANTSGLLNIDGINTILISDLTLQNGRKFDGNGGGAYIKDSNPEFRNVSFIHNIVVNDNTGGLGGHIYLDNSDAIFQNVLFTEGLSDGGSGDVMYMRSGSNPKIYNSTIVNNNPSGSGGYVFYVRTSGTPSSPIISNSIIILNSTPRSTNIINSVTGASITYTLSEQDFSARGNSISTYTGDGTDVFINPTNNFELKDGSPAIDIGNTAPAFRDPHEYFDGQYTAFPYPKGSRTSDVGMYSGPFSERPLRVSYLGPVSFTDGSWTTSGQPQLNFLLTAESTTAQVYYQIEIATNPAFGSPSTYMSPLVNQGFNTYTPSWNLPSASYYWRVKVSPDASNWSSWATANNNNIAFKVDRTNPTVSATNSDPSWFNTSRSASITAIDNESGIAQIRYNWNSNLLNTQCTTGGSSGTGGIVTVTPNLNGINTLYICTRDNLGNYSSVWSGTYNVDTTAPTATVSNGSVSWSNSAKNGTVSASDTGGSGINEIRYLWNSNRDLCTDGTIISNLGTTTNTPNLNGVNTLYICVKDNAGNTTTISGTYNVDTTAPIVSATNASATWFNVGRNGVVTASDTGGSLVNEIRYAWNTNNLNATCTGNGTVISNNGTTLNTPILNGLNTLYICTRDFAGNYSSVWSGTYFVDNIIPTVTVTAPVANNYYNETTLATIVGTANDSGGSSLKGPKSTQIAIKRVSDNKFWNFSGSWNSDARIWGFTDGLANWSYTGATNWVTGSYIIYAISEDNAGNYSTELSRTFYIDLAAPTVSASNASGTWYNTDRSATISAVDTGGAGLSTVRYSWDDNVFNSSCTGGTVTAHNSTITITTSGAHVLFICATDQTGNTSIVWTGNYNIDKELPTVSATNSSSTWFNEDRQATIMALDGYSGISTVRYSWDTNPFGSTCTGGTTIANGGTVSTNSDGAHTLYLCAIDTLGNNSTVWSGTYLIDETAPPISEIYPTATSNSIHGNMWNPAIGYTGADLFSGGTASNLTVDKEYDYTQTSTRFIRRIHGEIFNPAVGVISFDASSSTYAYLEESPQGTGNYLICGLAFNPAIGYIDLAPADNKLTPKCDPQFKSGHYNNRIQVNIANGGVTGKMWNPVTGYIGFGTTEGGNIYGFDLTKPILTATTNQNSDLFKYISRRGNKVNTFAFNTSEFITYVASVVNNKTGITAYTTTGTLGDLGGNAVSLTWSGENKNFSPVIRSVKNLASTSYGKMIPYGAVDWKVLSQYEKESNRMFDVNNKEETVFNFNGSTYLSSNNAVSSTTNLRFTSGGVTLEAWVYPDPLSVNRLPIVSLESTTGLANYQMYIQAPANTAENYLGFAFKSGSNTISCTTPVNSLPRDRFNFVSVTHTIGSSFDSATKLYINEIQYPCTFSGGVGSASPVTTGTQLYIGYTKENSGKYFDGLISDVTIFDRKRSQGEIAQDRGRILTGDEPGVKAHYILGNPKLAIDGDYVWKIRAYDPSLNYADDLVSYPFYLDNTPPLISNITLAYTVEPHFERNSAGSVIMNGSVTQNFTTKVVLPRAPDTDSYEISRDISSAPKVSMSFELDGVIGYSSIQVIPYVGATGPYPASDILTYTKSSPAKQINDIGLFANSASENLQVQEMTILVRDRANNESRKTIEVINNQPKIQVGKFATVSKASAPGMAQATNKVTCNKSVATPPFCDLINNTLVVSNIAKKTDAVLMNQSASFSTPLELDSIDAEGPVVYLNGLTGDSLTANNFKVKTNVPYTFNTQNTTDKSGILSYYWEIRKDTTLMKNGFSAEFEYTFPSTGNYTLYLKIMDTKGNSTVIDIPSTKFTVQTANDTINPVANAGDDAIWPVGVPYFFNAEKSSDDIQIAKNGYQWDFNDQDGTDFSNPDFIGKRATYTFNSAGSYTVTLKVIDTSGRENTDTVNLVIAEQDSFDNSFWNPITGPSNPDTSVKLSGLEFNGRQSVATFDAEKLKNEGRGTIEFWVKPSETPTGSDEALLSLGSGDLNQNSSINFLLNSERRLTLETTINDSTISGRYFIRLQTTNPLSTDKWSHIAWTFGESQESMIYKNRLFINGEKITPNYSFGNENLPMNFNQFSIKKAIIGSRIKTGKYQDFYHGYFDELKLWNYPIEETDMGLAMIKQHSGNENFLLYYYPLNGIKEIDTTKSLTFNGVVSKAVAKYHPKLNIVNGEISLGAFVKLDQQASGTQPIIAKTNATNQGNYAIDLNATSKNASFSFWKGNANVVCATANNVIIPGIAQYIVLNHKFGDNTKTTFYIDGIKTPCNFSGGTGTEIPSIGNDLNLGFNPNGNTYLKGTIDNVTIWKELRTLPEILRDLNGNITGFEKNLVAFYRFEEGKGFKVKNEVSQYFGELNLDNPIWSEDIPRGETKDGRTKLEETITSLHFNNNGYIETSDNNVNITTGDFTIEGLFKLPRVSYPTNLVSKKSTLTTGAGFVLYLDPMTNSIKARVNGSTQIELTSNRELSTLYDDKFHHLALTLNRSTNKLRLYIDGKLDQDTSGVSGTLANSEKFYLGKGIGGLSGYTGDMSEIRFWNIDRPENEIKRDLNKRITPKNGFYDQLSLYLKMSENGTTNKLLDYSKNNVAISATNTSLNSPKVKTNVPELTGQNNVWWNELSETTNYSAFFKEGSFLDIDKGYSVAFEDPTKFTIEFWTYLENIDNSPIILSNTNNQNFFLQITSDGKIQFQTRSGQIVNTIPGTFAVKKWNHIAVTHDASETEILLNGVSVATGIKSHPIIIANTNLVLGTDLNRSTYIQNGYITDFKIWKEKRTITEILQFLRTRVSKYYEKYNELSLYYKLDGEGNYNLVRDESFAITPTVGTGNLIIWSENAPSFENKYTNINSDLGHETEIIFSGQESISATTANSSYLDFDRDPLNIELWIKPQAGITTEQTILKKMEEINSRKYGYKFAINPAGKPFLELNDGAKTFTINSRKIITDAKWHHLSFSFDPTTSTIYLFIDGELQNTDRTKFYDLGSLKNGDVFEIGRYKAGDIRPLFAEVDTLRISSNVRYTIDFTPMKEFAVDSYTLALFNFDEGQGQITKDSSIFNTSLSLSSNLMWYSNLSYNYSANLNGSNNLVFANSNNFDLNTESFTIEFNAKVSNTAGTLFQWGTNKSNKIVIDYSSGGISIVAIGNDQQFINQQIPILINDNKWHHFALSVDRGGYLRFFIDGISRKIEAIESLKSTSLNLSSDNIYFGSDAGNGNTIIGELDNLHISKEIARYDSNFEPNGKIVPDKYSAILLRFSENAKGIDQVANEALTNPNFIFTATGITYTKLNSTGALYTVKKINDHSGHYLGVNPDTKKLTGKVWNPVFGYMDFDTATDYYSDNPSSSNYVKAPGVKNYNKDNVNKIYDLEGYFYSPTIGWTALESNQGKTQLDTRTGIIPQGLLFNPFAGFFDLSKKRIDTLDMEAPLLTLDPLSSTFLRSDIKSITISGHTSDRFGTGTAAIYYKLNTGGWRLALDDSLDHSFTDFHAIVNGLELGENKVYFKSVDKNGNTNEEASIMTLYRGYGITQKFFSPHAISKVTWKGDSTGGEGKIPSEVRILLSNNQDFLNDDTVTPALKTWEVVHTYGNRSAEEHIYTSEDFLASSGYNGNSSVRYARLMIEDTVGHEAPFLDGISPFKVYTKIDNTLTDPWSVEDQFENNLPGVEFYWDVAEDYVPKFRAYNPDFKGRDRTEFYLQSAPSFITNVLRTGSSNKSVKFRFSPSFDRDSRTLQYYFDSTIPAEDSVEIYYQTIVTK